VILYSIKDKILSEFLKLGLQDEFKEVTAAWLIYLDQQQFGKELEKKMIIEIDRYLAGKKTIDQIIEEVFKKTDWEFELIESIPANYVFKSILGFA